MQRNGRGAAGVVAGLAAIAAACAGAGPAGASPAGICGRWVDSTPSGTSPSGARLMAHDAGRGVTLVTTATQTWEWNGTAWTLRGGTQPQTNNPGSAGMAFDSLRNRMVIWHAFGAAPTAARTWEFNGMSWSQVATASVPPSFSLQSNPAMAFDSARGVVVLHYGASSETWEYNGTNWVNRSSMPRPTAGYANRMAYDSARGVCVYFNPGTRQTWEWNGMAWSQVATAASPQISDIPGMAYDATAGLVVLYGNQSGTTVEPVWTYDGANWASVTPPGAPTQADLFFQAELAHNPARDRVVMWRNDYPAATFELLTDSAALIVGQPQGVTVEVGDPIVLRVTPAVSGRDAQLVFQWRRNGVALRDQTGAALGIPSASAEDAGTYDVVVSNPLSTAPSCSTVSAGAVVAVRQDCPGDMNRDGMVNFLDLNEILANFTTECGPAGPRSPR